VIIRERHVNNPPSAVCIVIHVFVLPIISWGMFEYETWLTLRGMVIYRN